MRNQFRGGQVRAIGLISGGLDSSLAALLLMEQGIEVVGYSFVTPFFDSGRAEEAARKIHIPLRVVDITERHFEMLKNPPHGYGSGMNPCIDCHILMLQEAGKRLSLENAEFLFTGEVLGERPMSQNRRALETVARESGFAEVVLRPLSAKLLPPTRPEREGKVKRDLLLAIQGRSRKPQMQLAAKYHLSDYPSPAGGCLLTDPIFSRRLRDLLEHTGHLNLRDVELLKVGRHFRLSEEEKVIVGRDFTENQRILSLEREDDWILKVLAYKGPIALIPYGASAAAKRLSASIVVRYSDAPKERSVEVILRRNSDHEVLSAAPISEEELRRLRI